MSRDLAIDLGTANTLVWARGRGMVVDEPTVVAIHQRTGEVRAMGRQAYELIAKNSGRLLAHRPIAGGAVADFHATTKLLALVLQRLGLSRFSRARVLLCVPNGVTEVERRALREASARAGAASTYLMEEPVAAAIGAGLPIDEPRGTMLLDAGGGSTQVAMLSLGGIVTGAQTRIGGFDLDAAIAAYVRERFDLAIGERTAEDVKIAIGAAYPQHPEPHVEVRGRALASGLEQTVALGGHEVRLAIEACVSEIVRTVVDALGQCPPDLAQDVLDEGLWLCGGGARLEGLAARITADAEIPVRLASEPDRVVILGAGRTLEEFDSLRHLLAKC